MRDAGFGSRLRWAAVVWFAAWLPLSAAPKHTLWKVSSAGNHVYIQGSVHLLKPERYPLAEPIEAAFAESEGLVLETDLGAARDPSRQLAVLARAMLPEGRTLRRVLTDDTWRGLQAEAKAAGLNPAVLEPFKPWYAAMTLSLAKLQSLGFNPTDGVDWHFYRRAVERGIPVKGLETLDEQMALFDGIPDAQQEALVRQMLDDFETIEAEMDRIVEAWATGDMAGLEATLLKHFKDYPRLYKRFVIDRNRAWVPQIDTLLQGGKVHLVVVGAGHLPGRQGLIALLKQKGYRVEQR